MYTTLTHIQERLEDSTDLVEPPGPSLVLILYSVLDKPQLGEPSDLIADLETTEIANAIAHALRQMNCPVAMAAIRSEEDIISSIRGFDPQTTLVFNICETLGGYSTKESVVPELLEQFGFCYVGATPDNLDVCLFKDRTKRRLLKHGIPTAPYQVFHTNLEPVSVPLPAIVKPVAEDCSLGINLNAVVCDERSLRRQVAYVLDVYKQAALAEMYLNGREFSVSLWGNGTTHVLAVAQVDFSNHGDRWPVDDFESKWCNRYSAIYPAPIDRELENTIRRLALKTYHALGCQDYARVDLRENDGQLYVMDVNPNPGLSQDAGFARAAGLAGYDYAHMALQLVQWAWRRKSEKNANHA